MSSCSLRSGLPVTGTCSIRSFFCLCPLSSPVLAAAWHMSAAAMLDLWVPPTLVSRRFVEAQPFLRGLVGSLSGALIREEGLECYLQAPYSVPVLFCHLGRVPEAGRTKPPALPPSLFRSLGAACRGARLSSWPSKTRELENKGIPVPMLLCLTRIRASPQPQLPLSVIPPFPPWKCQAPAE